MGTRLRTLRRAGAGTLRATAHSPVTCRFANESKGVFCPLQLVLSLIQILTTLQPSQHPRNPGSPFPTMSRAASSTVSHRTERCNYTVQPSNFQVGDANFLWVNTFKCLGFMLKIPNLKNHSVSTFPLGTFLSVSFCESGRRISSTW